MAFLLKTYEIATTDFPTYRPYSAATPAQARAKAWNAYCSYRQISFRDFLQISTVRRADDPTGFGREIIVGGTPAHWVGFDGQYVRFCRPDETTVLISHPNDVSEVAA